MTLCAYIICTVRIPVYRCANASSTVAGQKTIVANSKTISSPFTRVAQNTTYMPIWYIGQSLQSLGIQQFWDGTNRVWKIVVPSTAKIDLSGIDLGSGNTDIYLNGQLVKRINTYAWLDPSSGYKSNTIYAPVQFQSMYYRNMVDSALSLWYLLEVRLNIPIFSVRCVYSIDLIPHYLFIKIRPTYNTNFVEMSLLLYLNFLVVF